MVKTGTLRLMGDSVQFSSPILLSLLIQHIEQPDTPQWRGVLLCLLLFVCLCIEALIKLRYQNSMHQTGLMMKAAVVDYTYQKAIKIMSGTTAANIVNVLRIDCECFFLLNRQIHLVWSNPFVVSMCIYLLYVQLKSAAFIGLIAVFLITLLNVMVLYFMQHQVEKSRELKDHKLSLVNEVVTAIKQIKFYQLENAFHHNLKEARLMELKAYNRTQILVLIVHASLELSPTIIGVACISGYLFMFTGQGITAGQLFVSLSILNVLKVPLYSVSDVIRAVQESNISCKRLVRFLNVQEIDRDLYINYDDSDEFDVNIENCSFKHYKNQLAARNHLLEQREKARKQQIQKQQQQQQNMNAQNENSPSIQNNLKNLLDNSKNVNSSFELKPLNKQTNGVKLAQNGSNSPKTQQKTTEFKAVSEKENKNGCQPNFKKQFQLDSISLKIKTGSLVAIIGSVESGKTALLSAIGGEMELVHNEADGNLGSLKRKRVSWDLQHFVSLPNSVQRNIILFDQQNLWKADWVKYRKTLYACALFPDIPTLPDGNSSIIESDFRNI